MPRKYSTIVPKSYKGLVRVGSLKALFETAAEAPDHVNAVLYRRRLRGDFAGLARALDAVDNAELLTMWHARSAMAPLGPCGKAFPAEAATIREDMETFIPILRAGSMLRKVPARGMEGYPDDGKTFHADDLTWRLMCCYNAPVTEWIRNEDIGKESTLAMEAEGGKSYPVYFKKDGAPSFRFRPGDIWLHSGLKREGAAPFPHRAIIDNDGLGTPRLVFVGECKKPLFVPE